MIVALGSKNPIKYKATVLSFQQFFPNEEIIVKAVAVKSGVSDMPTSMEETIQGATNRAYRARQQIKEADFGVGIEGGLFYVNSFWYLQAWIVIVANRRPYKTAAATFALPVPQQIINPIMKEHVELEEVVKKMFFIEDIGEKIGFFGLATKEAVTRLDAFCHAFSAALYPFYNENFQRFF